MSAARITTAALLERHRPFWRVVCRNPFLVGVRDGSLPVETFDRWLVQDRHFMDGIFAPTSRTLAAAPVRDRDPLLQALRQVHANLAWFDRTLAQRGLDRDAAVHPVCRAYVDYIVALGFERYPIALVALWAQYRAYYDAWAWAHPGAPKFRKVILNWYSPEYRRFVKDLERAADFALAGASPEEIRRADETVVQVARYELAFWIMTMEERPPA
jgi:thiaminase